MVLCVTVMTARFLTEDQHFRSAWVHTHGIIVGINSEDNFPDRWHLHTIPIRRGIMMKIPAIQKGKKSTFKAKLSAISLGCLMLGAGLYGLEAGARERGERGDRSGENPAGQFQDRGRPSGTNESPRFERPQSPRQEARREAPSVQTPQVRQEAPQQRMPRERSQEFGGRNQEFGGRNPGFGGRDRGSNDRAVPTAPQAQAPQAQPPRMQAPEARPPVIADQSGRGGRDRDQSNRGQTYGGQSQSPYQGQRSERGQTYGGQGQSPGDIRRDNYGNRGQNSPNANDSNRYGRDEGRGNRNDNYRQNDRRNEHYADNDRRSRRYDNDRGDRGRHWNQNRRNHYYNESYFRGFSGVRIGFYFAPSYGYYQVPTQYYGQRYRRGQYLPRFFYDYRVTDYDYFDLPYPPYGTAYFYCGQDIVLIDLRTGEILDVFYDIY